MYINENRLNKIVNDSVEKILSEAWGNQGWGNQNNTSQKNTEFNQDTVDVNRKNRPGSAGSQILKGAGKGAATYVGAGLGAGVLGTMLGMGAGAMAGMGNIMGALGLGMVAANLAGNLIALKRAQQLKFPRSPYQAMEYARFAAAERAEAQDMCKKIQGNIQNAIAAYNQQYNKDLDTNDATIFGNATATFQDRGQKQSVNVDWERDFSNINAGQNESRIYESFQSAEQFNKQTPIIEADTYLTQFSQMQEAQALQVIQKLKDDYTQAYGLWMQWTRYINVLVHAFQKYGLTWEEVINSNKNASTKSIIKAFVKNKLGIVDNDDVNSYHATQGTMQTTVRVKNLNYTIGKGNNVKSYVLLKNINNNSYYALPQINSINNVPLKKEMPLNLSLDSKMIVGKIPTQDGKQIQILSQTATQALSLVMNNNGNQHKTI